MKKLRTVFMGTGPFAAPILQALITTGYDVVAVYTKPQTDNARSRRKAPPNPVRAIAQTANIPIEDPHEPLRTPAIFAQLRSYAPEIIIVAAYGKILPQSVLDLPQHSCVNVHASLLPRWRGAAPIHAAIAAGDTTTGVTIMRIDAGLDTGPIIAQRTHAITPDMHTPELFSALATDGAQLLIETLPSYCDGTRVPQQQDDAQATTCHTLTRSDGCIAWHMTTQEIYNRFRAFDPWPGIFTRWQRSGKVLSLKLLDITPLPHAPTQPPGTVFRYDSHALCIATGDSAISIHRLQMAGKKSTDAQTFCNGYSDIFSARMDGMC